MEKSLLWKLKATVMAGTHKKQLVYEFIKRQNVSTF